MDAFQSPAVGQNSGTNCLPRGFVRQILTAVKVPPMVVKVWIGLLDSVHKGTCGWGSLSGGFTSRTGIPVGDPLSVLTSAVCGAFWLHRIKLLNGIGADGKVIAMVFVDNLDLIAVVAETLRLQDELALQIDAKKSWTWTVNVQPKNRPQVTWKRQQHGKCLGAPMTYIKLPRNAVQIARIEAAIPRLKKIERLPIESKEKIRLIKAGVIQAALACSEITFLGGKHFQHFRDHICTAVCHAHNWAHRKTALFLHDPDIDPMLCALFMQIRMLRRSLWSNDQAWSFALGVLSGDIEHSGTPFGPLTALRAYLAGIGLTVDNDGFVHSSGRPKVHLREVLCAWGVLGG